MSPLISVKEAFWESLPIPTGQRGFIGLSIRSIFGFPIFETGPCMDMIPGKSIFQESKMADSILSLSRVLSWLSIDPCIFSDMETS